MIDIHSHILPCVDDGSQSIEESLALLTMLQTQGIEAVIATPHFYAHRDNPEAFLQRRNTAFSQLEDFLQQRRGALGLLEVEPDPLPKRLLGAEVAYFDGMSRSQELSQLQLGDSGLLLVEMPFRDWTSRMIDEICSLPIQLGVTPVLAHVERYPGRTQLNKYMIALMEQGVYFQCNAEAFLSGLKSLRYLRMVNSGHVQFLGSDCHNLKTRPPKLDQALRIIEKKCAPRTMERLQDFPRSIFLSETNE